MIILSNKRYCFFYPMELKVSVFEMYGWMSFDLSDDINDETLPFVVFYLDGRIGNHCNE